MAPEEKKARRRAADAARRAAAKAPAKKVAAKTAAKAKPAKPKAKPAAKVIPPEVLAEAKTVELSPLDYMLKVMRDPEEEPIRRDRMAIAAAPFVHARADVAKPGKREQQKERAAVAGGGKFAAPQGPRLAVNNN